MAMVLGVVLGAGCGGGNAVHDAGVMDLSGGDAAAGNGSIGAVCTADSSCTEGAKPSCFKQTLFNDSNTLDTAQGYCSSTCTADSDCGSNGSCHDFGAPFGKWCFAHCKAASGCRDGYACFYASGGYCFPDGRLSCDPTAVDGACTTFDSRPGGCVRVAHGTGNKGYCYDACQPGPGACPASGGSAQQCEIYDETHFKEPAATEKDQFHGGLCVPSYSTHGAGMECTLTSGGQTVDRIDACADGLECWLEAPFGGDNLCHPFCTPTPGGSPTDGGDPGSCSGGQICDDVFGLFAGAHPIGLCH
jgi:hypothetical protein